MIEHEASGAIGPKESSYNLSPRQEKSRPWRLWIMVKVLGPALALSAVLSACETGVQGNPTTEHTPIVDSTCRFYENELTVTFKDFREGENSSEIQNILDQHDARVIRSDSRLDAWLLEVPPESRDELEEALDSDPRVEVAEKSYVVRDSDLPADFCVTPQPAEF